MNGQVLRLEYQRKVSLILPKYRRKSDSIVLGENTDAMKRSLAFSNSVLKQRIHTISADQREAAKMTKKSRAAIERLDSSIHGAVSAKMFVGQMTPDDFLTDEERREKEARRAVRANRREKERGRQEKGRQEKKRQEKESKVKEKGGQEKGGQEKGGQEKPTSENTKGTT